MVPGNTENSSRVFDELKEGITGNLP